MVIDKKETLWERNDKEELIPQQMEFEYKINNEVKKAKFSSTILTRIELTNVLTGKTPSGEKSDDTDGDIILHCVKEPKYTKDEIGFMKKEFCVPMTEKILEESGLRKPTVDELKKVLGRTAGKEEGKKS